MATSRTGASGDPSSGSPWPATGRPGRRPPRRARSRTAGLRAAGAAALAAVLLAGGCADGSATREINLYISPEEGLQEVVDRCNAEADGRYRIVYNQLPRDADGQREQMVRRLAAEDTGLDVLGLDVTWIPEFAEAGWIEEWTGEHREEAVRDVLSGPLETAVWNDRVYGAPKNTNIQLLWYDNRITPEPPRTWDEMIRTAQRLRRDGRPYQVLFTGAQYEGLVVFFNSLVASAGGTLLSDDGTEAVVDEGVVEALRLLKRLTTSGVTSPSLTNQREDEVRLAFQQGRGAFEFNWPYVYASYRQEKPDDLRYFRWARYPVFEEGDVSRATAGGYNLAVSSYSRNKPAAFEAALCLRSAESQKFQALRSGLPPSIETVYDDDTPLDPDRPADPETNPTMATEYPPKETIRAALEEAAVRPLTPVYQNLSTVTAKILSPPSAIDPERTAERLREELDAALKSQGVLP
ncbi:ABC transporter substrate-binding protein [Streptomyces alkaliterrae]|uniref:ABC transporter substrate-binding protein n=1 Tax=Streptomyces alkaliterrae TaxID=2213162 RepID=A0A5P0YPR5_9ACTN|nr:ABC transporter substrate-binding protein [Streptomyces alkaliterrae]MBB1259269.1 ABC transporter substrate-binding protein [Streptomyces alkaliterrae]MQS02306.1 extracellular solute-binding protein [Streptomyces alkaliterrae]